MKILQTIQANPVGGADASAHKNRFSVQRTAGTMPVYTSRPAAMSYAPDGSPIPATAIKKEAQGPSFADLIDIINPLQHIPVVGTLYRKITGDEISPPARVIGAAVFGGPIGGALALADEAIRAETGTGLGEKALAYAASLRGEDRPRMAGSIPVWSTAPVVAALTQSVDDNHNIS